MDSRSGLQQLLDNYGATDVSEDSQDGSGNVLLGAKTKTNNATSSAKSKRNRKQGKVHIRRVVPTKRLPTPQLKNCTVSLSDVLDGKNAAQLQKEYGVKLILPVNSSTSKATNIHADDLGLGMSKFSDDNREVYECLNAEDHPMPEGVHLCKPHTAGKHRMIRRTSKVQLSKTVDARFLDYSLTTMSADGEWRPESSGSDFVRLKETDLTQEEIDALPVEQHQAQPSVQVPWGQMPTATRFPNRPTRTTDMPDTTDCDPEETRRQCHNASNRTFYFNEKVRKRYLQLGVQAYRSAFLDLYARIAQFEHTGELQIPAYYKFPIYEDAEMLVEDEEEETERHRQTPARTAPQASPIIRRSQRRRN